jgi:hypothetical protein
VQYADKTYRWVRLPVRSESPLPLHYQRLLALTESTNHLLPNPPTDEQLHRRRLAGNLHSIPFHPTLLPNQQYREPDEYSKQMLSAYARYAARHFKHLEDPNVPVTAVKLYRVTHGIVAAPQLASEISPLDPTLYLPFYQGEFDPDGRLKDPQDPFLYWLLPIYYDESRPGPDVRFRVPGQPGDKLVNCLSIHAGDAGPDLTGGDNLP